MPLYTPPSTAGSGSSTDGSNPYLLPPSNPSIYDDEFDAGSPDLEVRGWKFRDMAAPTVPMIWDGPIQPFYFFSAAQANPIPVGHYRSTIYGSVLYIQLALTINKEYLMYKPVPAISATWPAGAYTWLRAARYGHANALAVSGRIHSEYAYTTGGGLVWDDLNRVIAATQQNGATQNNDILAGRAIAAAPTYDGVYAEYGSTGQKYDIIGQVIYANASGVVTNTRRNAFYVESAALAGVLYDVGKMHTYAMDPTKFTAIGLRMVGGNAVTIQTGPSVPYAYAIDFVRYYAGDITNKWIAG